MPFHCKVKVKRINDIHVALRVHTSVRGLRDVTCRMESHSVTSEHVNAPRLTSVRKVTTITALRVL